MWDLDIVIDGRAATKGSGQAGLTKKGKAFFRVDNPTQQRNWAQIVHAAVRPHWVDGDGQPLAPAAKGVPVTLRAEFVLPRKANTPVPTPPHTEPPDWDKLARALGDALTGLIYVDDAQVNEPYTPKRYARPGEEPHVHLQVLLGEPPVRATVSP